MTTKDEILALAKQYWHRDKDNIEYFDATNFYHAALPADTSALEAMITKAGEVMRERCAMQFAVFKWRDTAKDLIRALPGITIQDIL